MKELRDSLGQAVNLIIQDDNDAIYVEKMEGVQPVRVYTAVGRKSTALCWCMSKNFTIVFL